MHKRTIYKMMCVPSKEYDALQCEHICSVTYSHISSPEPKATVMIIIFRTDQYGQTLQEGAV